MRRTLQVPAPTPGSHLIAAGRIGELVVALSGFFDSVLSVIAGIAMTGACASSSTAESRHARSLARLRQRREVPGHQSLPSARLRFRTTFRAGGCAGIGGPGSEACPGHATTANNAKAGPGDLSIEALRSRAGRAPPRPQCIIPCESGRARSTSDRHANPASWHVGGFEGVAAGARESPSWL